MRAQTEMLFFRWVTLTEHKWVIFRERRSLRVLIAIRMGLAIGFRGSRWVAPDRETSAARGTF